MSETSHAAATGADQVRSGAPPRTTVTEPSAWVGWAVFAAVLMILMGVFHAIAGLVALFNQTYYVVPAANMVVTVSYTGWGWVHLIGGIVIFLAGVALLAGQTWARVVAIVLAGLSAIVNVAFLTAWPVWSVIVIALDVMVIYALTVHGKELKAEAY
ncbi:DUF7144 family membrane protein [Pseudonocardia acidicola]|uniref:DUF7144 domain-containing protein n=1 Tax=Pseudonocardia acidicola TaxID=2724939 RepID=A0ABX1S7B0_9PSEU|nr:hypothetical protein [Pseudonocardia acidicola]NMH96990.1 hypothetical protein [Pseudonocardia acidicola]